MRVEQSYLGNRRGAHESGVLVELWADLHAATARNAARKRIRLFLLLHGYPWSRAEVVGAVDRHPCLHPLQVLEQDAAVHRKITNDRKLRKRFQPDRLVQVVD